MGDGVLNPFPPWWSPEITTGNPGGKHDISKYQGGMDELELPFYMVFIWYL